MVKLIFVQNIANSLIFSKALKNVYMTRYGKKRKVSTWRRISNGGISFTLICFCFIFHFFRKGSFNVIVLTVVSLFAK